VLLFEIRGTEYSDICRNRTSVIEKRLHKYAEIAAQHGKKRAQGSSVNLPASIRTNS